MINLLFYPTRQKKKLFSAEISNKWNVDISSRIHKQVQYIIMHIRASIYQIELNEDELFMWQGCCFSFFCSFVTRTKVTRWVLVLAILIKLHLSHGEIFSESCLSKSNLDCNYTFPIELAPVEMCQFTRIQITRFKVSFMLQNFSQCR